jgi:hypothetical protein
MVTVYKNSNEWNKILKSKVSNTRLYWCNWIVNYNRRGNRQ